MGAVIASVRCEAISCFSRFISELSLRWLRREERHPRNDANYGSS